MVIMNVSYRVCPQQTGMMLSTMVCGHLGDKPSRRQSSRRQTNSATQVGQLGDNLFPAFKYIYIYGYNIIGTATSVHLWYNGIINFVTR